MFKDNVIPTYIPLAKECLVTTLKTTAITEKVDEKVYESMNREDKMLAEILEVNPSVISRVRRFRYHDLGQDILWRMITNALEIIDGKN